MAVTSRSVATLAQGAWLLLSGATCSIVSGLDDFKIADPSPSSSVGGGGEGGWGSGGAGGMSGCTPEESQTCETSLGGACEMGTMTCDEQGVFGMCIADASTVEDCGVAGDENCDGADACTGDAVFTVGLGLEPDGWGLGVGVGADRHGNVTVAGIQHVDGGSGNFEGTRMFLARYNGAGDLREKKEIGEADSIIIPWGLALRGDESLVVTGWLKGSADFDGDNGPVGDVMSSGDGMGNDLFVAKLKSDLSLEWVEAFSGNGSYQSRAVLDGAGGILVAGGFSVDLTFDQTVLSPAAGATDGFVIKLDSSGNPLWSRQLHAGPNSTALVRGLAVDPETQDVFVAGSFQGSIDLDGPNGSEPPVNSVDVFPQTGSSDIFVARLESAQGTLVWQRIAGDELPQQLTGLAVDAAGDVVLTGGFQGTLALGGGVELIENDAPNDAIFVAKLRGSHGTPLWNKASGADIGGTGAIAVDGAGQILLAGHTNGNQGLGFCPDFPASPVSVYAFVAKLAPDGACLWARRSSQPGEQGALAVAADPLGNVLLTGRFVNNIDFGGDPSAPTTDGGAADAFLAKLLP